MKIKFEAETDYCFLFNYNTGTSVTLEKKDFFIRDKGPNLLDVSITNRCDRGCNFCYRQSSALGEDITLENYRIILQNANDCGVQQIALGGGEPTLHPKFCDILKMTRVSGIVPNYSTNGGQLTPDILYCSTKYCGAIALSVYDDLSKYETIVKKITDYGIKLNLHLILRKDRIEEYIKILRYPPEWITRINAIIFLNYKPANGNDSLCLKNCTEDIVSAFFESVKLFKACGIGFDTCSISFVCKKLDVDNSLYDFCEAGRKSAYINEKLEVYPCSFYKRGGISLKKDSLKNIWHTSHTFIEHRKLLEPKIQKCEHMNACRSGCPIYAINSCSECNTF